MVQFNFPKTIVFVMILLQVLRLGQLPFHKPAFALLGGLPPIYGLYGSLFPLIVYALMGTSNYLNLGPVSVISIFVFTTLNPFVTPFTDDYINAVIVLGIIIGLIQITGGVLKLGRYFDYIPKSVVSGFVQAAAVVIMVSQIPPAFKINLPNDLNYIERIVYLIGHIDMVHTLTSVFFIGALMLLIYTPSFCPKVSNCNCFVDVNRSRGFYFWAREARNSIDWRGSSRTSKIVMARMEYIGIKLPSRCIWYCLCDHSGEFFNGKKRG